jgi:putative radical SAM enzyme (TIGR03279 family)
MKEKRHVISSVQPGSIAWELELEPGDTLLEINGQSVEDVFDYRYLIEDEELLLVVKKQNGEMWELEVEKDYEEDLGIEFENGLMDDYRSCSNRCIFCFIDQMPPGMRETLYFKDDDSRLSFLQGNYVTLTNMKEHDMERVIRYHLSPINISFQTMNPELRCKMLHNRFAGEALKKVERFYEAGITMNGQIVLCKGINDGEELEYSLKELSRYAPQLQSVSVVPVGLTKYREELYPLQEFSREDAVAVLAQIHRWQEHMMEEHGIHFVHASDEWYILAGQEMPAEETYDGYLQLENGVGMLRLLCEEVKTALEARTGDDRRITGTIATGVLAAPYLRKNMDLIREKFPNVDIRVIPIENRFFGKQITVSGLVTGGDLLEQLRGQELGDKLLIPCNMLRSGEDVFLDDLTVSEISEKLAKEITVVESEGADLVKAVLDADTNRIVKRRQMYEQSNCSNCGQA